MLFIQLTGLSGAGKTSIANAVQASALMLKHKLIIEVIDADEYRRKFHPHLGYSKADRIENIRRLGKIAGEFTAKGMITIVAAINPYQEVRDELKHRYCAKTVWIKCKLDELIKRDPKGLYKRALMLSENEEKIHNLTGVNDPYEEPEDADLIIDTGIEDLPTSTARLTSFILQQLNTTA